MRPWAEVDDDAFVALTHESGAVSHLSMSAVAAAPGPEVPRAGHQGRVELLGLDGQEDAMRAGKSPYDTPSHHARLLTSSVGRRSG